MKHQIFGDASGQTSALILTVCLTLQKLYFFHCNEYISLTAINIFFTATNIFLHQVFWCRSLTSSGIFLSLVVCICAGVWFPWTFSGKPLSTFLSPEVCLHKSRLTSIFHSCHFCYATICMFRKLCTKKYKRFVTTKNTKTNIWCFCVFWDCVPGIWNGVFYTSDK